MQALSAPAEDAACLGLILLAGLSATGTGAQVRLRALSHCLFSSAGASVQPQIALQVMAHRASQHELGQQQPAEEPLSRASHCWPAQRAACTRAGRGLHYVHALC